MPHGDPVLKVRTLDMTEGGLSLLLSLPLSWGLAAEAAVFAICFLLSVSKLLNILSFSSKACASLASSSYATFELLDLRLSYPEESLGELDLSLLSLSNN